jgi:polygalacturonase
MNSMKKIISLFPLLLLLTITHASTQVTRPTGVMVAPGTLSDDAVTVIWQKPDQHKKIVGYRVYVNGKEIAKVQQCNFRITGLKPSAGYQVAVAAEGAGEMLSAQTAFVSIITKPKSTVLNVADFGAKGDALTLNTVAIQKAIDACPYQGTVRIPPGTFLSGALHLKSNMTLLIEKGGVLQGSQRETDYLPMIRNRFEGWELDTYASLINAGQLNHTGGYTAENIAIRGEGSIVGGSRALAKSMIAQKGMRGRGRLICLLNCRNVEIQGLEIKDSPCWTIHYIYSSNITCHDLAISSTVENGDGIDPDSSVDSYIFNCSFSTTDDCIAIKSGKNPEGYFIGKPTKNIQVTSCDFKSGHGISIGSEISGGISHILVRDCKAGNLIYGLQVKGTPERGGVVEHIVVKDCQLRKISILTKLPYNNDGAAAPQQPLFRDFEFSAIDMTEATEKEGIITINGFSDSLHYTSGLSFSGIKLPEDVSVKIAHAKNIHFQDVKTLSGHAPQYLVSNSFEIHY